MRGSVKWFNGGKGYGFVTVDGGEDVFIHANQLKKSGITDLGEGDRLEFEVQKAPKGLQAVSIQKI
jgi:CspA family cold shock protein